MHFIFPVIVALSTVFAAVGAAAHELVQVDVIYDVSDSRNNELFTSLQKTFADKDISAAVRIKLTPAIFGNATNIADGSLDCTRKDGTCDFQVTQLCASKQLNAIATVPENFFLRLAAFVHCLKTWAPTIIGYIAYCWISNYDDSASKRAVDARPMEIKAIEQCVNSPSERAAVASAATSAAANLKVASLPALLINNQPTDFADLQSAICNYYAGHIGACSKK